LATPTEDGSHDADGRERLVGKAPLIELRLLSTGGEPEAGKVR
jgi:hypothetical protein